MTAGAPCFSRGSWTFSPAEKVLDLNMGFSPGLLAREPSSRRGCFRPSLLLLRGAACRKDRVDVNAHRVRNAARVPARQRDRDGHLVAARIVENKRVAPRKAFHRQRKPSELIFAVRIGAPDVKQNLRREIVK